MKRVLLAWSSGKDSAWTLHRLRLDAGLEVAGLFTTLDPASGCVGMHGVPAHLVERQSEAAGLPLLPVAVPWPCSNTVYAEAVLRALAGARDSLGITHVAFGDLFLEEVRAYREALLHGTGLEPLFPLWGEPTADLAREMVDGGLRAQLTCVDPRRLPAEFLGRQFDAALLRDLPPGVDPCGEAGEFHTFAWAGPMFSRPVSVRLEGRAERDGFVYPDRLA